MSKVMQNLVVLMEPFEDAYRIDMKAGNMILNRFCINEDAAFELSGVDYLRKSSWKAVRKVKGKEYSFSWSETFLIQFAK